MTRGRSSTTARGARATLCGNSAPRRRGSPRAPQKGVRQARSHQKGDSWHITWVLWRTAMKCAGACCCVHTPDRCISALRRRGSPREPRRGASCQKRSRGGESRAYDCTSEVIMRAKASWCLRWLSKSLMRETCRRAALGDSVPEDDPEEVIVARLAEHNRRQERLAEALRTGLRIVVDCSFIHGCNDREVRLRVTDI